MPPTTPHPTERVEKQFLVCINALMKIIIITYTTIEDYQRMICVWCMYEW